MARQIISTQSIYVEKNNIHRIVARFNSFRQRLYVYTKLRLDPVYSTVERLLANNNFPLLDIGCGMGLLADYLSEQGKKMDYLGLETIPAKLRQVARQLQ